jgi:hypothetical protein
MCMANYKKSQFDLLTSLAVNNDRNVDKCQFLLSLTQLSIRNNKFLGKGFKPKNWSKCIIHICNMFSLTTYVQRMSFARGVQTIISTLKLGPLPKFARLQRGPNWEIGIVWPQFIRILCTLLIPVTMYYHTHKGNGQLSKPIYHFVAHLQP